MPTFRGRMTLRRSLAAAFVVLALAAGPLAALQADCCAGAPKSAGVVALASDDCCGCEASLAPPDAPTASLLSRTDAASGAPAIVASVLEVASAELESVAADSRIAASPPAPHRAPTPRRL